MQQHQERIGILREYSYLLGHAREYRIGVGQSKNHHLTVHRSGKYEYYSEQGKHYIVESQLLLS